jgi:WD40 repeat protein
LADLHYGKTLRLWDLQSAKCLKVLKGHVDRVTSLALSADGRLAVSGSEDNTLRIWDLTSGKCLKVLEGHGARVTFIVLSADGRLAFSASGDNTLRVWDLHTGITIAVFSIRGIESFRIDWSRRRLAASFSDGRVEFYQIHNLTLGPIITTALRDLISEDLPPGTVTARPACCGQVIAIQPNLAESIEYWHIVGHDRSDRAYTDPTLLLNCPHCNTPLRMNPFFVDLRPLQI